MQTLIKPSAAIRQNYSEIAKLCKETGEPVFLTKNGEGDLVVMDIAAYDQREKQLELREKLVEIEELRKSGLPDTSARTVSENLRAKLKEKAYVQG
ncbi:MAG: type II toxin-antitoxin system Phd/YefM family antitoxin [Acetatifactor sp.]|nr:type II toxin-antitoxin system Phd/YefM family antitoxin [Acetatifactor sp.]